MNDKIKGVVLRIYDYKDNDQMMYVLSEEYGMLSLIAKGSKKITSKHHFFDACLYEFIIDYKDNKSIYSIHGSKLLKSYYELDDTKMMAFKNIVLEAIIKSKDVLDYDSYPNLLIYLDNLNKENKYLLGSLYFSYLCRLHGIMPNVDECVICKKKKVVSVSNRFGGFVCEEHASGLDLLDVDTLKKFRLIIKAQFKDLDLIKDNIYNFSDFKLIIDFFCMNSGLNLKTYEFYKIIN